MKRCPECGVKHEDEVLTCDCGAELGGVTAEEKKRGPSSVPVYEAGDEPDRPVFLIGGLRMFSGLALAGGVVGLLLFMGSSIWMGIGYAVGGLLTALVLGALTGNLELLSDIAENTQSSAAHLERIAKSLAHMDSRG